MRVTIDGYTVNFTNLLWQRNYANVQAHPVLAFWYVVIQALAALIPWSIPFVHTVHEGLGRNQIGTDMMRRTGRYSFDSYRALFIVPGLYSKECDALSRIWMLRGFGWRVCLNVFRLLMFHQRHDYQPILRELIYRSIPYRQFFQETETRHYVTTSTGQFPESPAVAVANAMGIKTILWQYGVQHVLPTDAKPLRWDVPAAKYPAVKEIHVWNNWAKRIWNEQINVNPPPAIIVDGPRMLGKKPLRFPLSVLIGVADTPAKLTPHGIITQEWVERFYAHLYDLAIRHPTMQFVVKTKYDGDTIAHCFLREAFCRLPNVETLDANCNPWLLIEKCGRLVCLPYSSMGVAAMTVGREVIFYDPTGAAKYYPDTSLLPYYRTGPEELKLCLLQPLRLYSAKTGVRHYGHR